MACSTKLKTFFSDVIIFENNNNQHKVYVRDAQDKFVVCLSYCHTQEEY